MVRTKQAGRKKAAERRAREADSNMQTDDPIRSEGDGSDVHIKMEEGSEDGGVELEQRGNALMQPIETSGAPSFNSEPFFQQLVSPQDPSTLQWQLPIQTLHVKPIQLKKNGILGPARVYHHSSSLVQKFWKSLPSNFVPSPLQDRTPYSMAMLLMLRKLANVTKDDQQLAQALMMEAFERRLGEWQNQINEHGGPMPNHESGIFLVQTITGIKRGEKTVTENLFGLTLADVEAAAERRNETKPLTKKQAKQANKQKAQKQAKADKKNGVKVEQTDVAQRVVERRRAERAEHASQRTTQQQAMRQQNPYAALDDIAGGVDSAAADEVSAETFPTFQMQSLTIRTRQRQPKANAPQSTLDKWTRKALAGDEMAAVLPRGQDRSKEDKENRENDLRMSELMNGMDMDKVKPSRNRRQRRKLAFGGDSRDRAPGNLPAERFNFNDMPQLPGVGTRTDAGGLMSMGQQSLPD